MVLLVIDAEEGIIEQDKRVAGYAHEEGKAMVIVVNKWDAVEKDTNTMKNLLTMYVINFNFRLCTYRFRISKRATTIKTLFPYIREASENHKNVFKAQHLTK